MPDATPRVAVSASPASPRRDAIQFLRAFLKAPLRTGATFPSGPVLAREMASGIDLTRPGWIVELGPGTGPVTRALVRRGVPEERLVLVEADPGFCALLRQRHPRARVVHGDALHLRRTLTAHGIEPVSTVISSLPLLNFPPRLRLRMARDALHVLGEGGVLVQFTYGLGSPVPLRGADVEVRPAPRIWRNLWPAKVWRYRRSA